MGADPVAGVFPYRRWEVRNLVNVSRRHRAIYVATPKVGCSTIKRTLQLLELDGDASRLPANVHLKRESPLAHPYTPGIGFMEMLAAPETFRFCFVRNPYSRFVSAFLDKILLGDPENDSRARVLTAMRLDPALHVDAATFLQRLGDVSPSALDVHFAPQSFLLQPQAVRYDLVGRFETFEADLRRVMARLVGEQRAAASVVRMQAHAVGADALVERVCGGPVGPLIRTVYAADFAAFGYADDWQGK